MPSQKRYWWRPRGSGCQPAGGPIAIASARRPRAGDPGVERHALAVRRLVGVDDVHQRVDEREVREGLREVAEVAARPPVDLLRVEAERAGVAEQLLAQLARANRLADLAQRRHEPERADGEGALFPPKPSAVAAAREGRAQAS